MMVANLCVGICTPPVGSALFIGSSVAGVQIGGVVKHMLPMYGALVIVLLLVSFVPELSLFLPRALGLLE
jgi:TRAP-type C4-dicarboxylate transport system permease large subunit